MEVIGYLRLLSPAEVIKTTGLMSIRSFSNVLTQSLGMAYYNAQDNINLDLCCVSLIGRMLQMFHCH